MTRLFTDAELAALAEPPSLRVQRAIETGDVASVGRLVEDLEAEFRNVIRGFEVWAGITQSWLARRGRPRSSAGGGLVEQAWLVAGCHGVTPEVLQRTATSARAEVQDLMRRSADNALALYVDVEDAYRRLHDAHRDWVSTLLSHVYRSDGVDGLEACLRVIGDKTLLRWMERDLRQEPSARLRTWVALLHANFATLTLTEDHEWFTIVQDPCGTCTRQILDGAYGSPLDLAVVQERHPATYGLGGLPVYRCHVAVCHRILPTERTGAPWPLHACPPGLAVSACRIDIAKAPSNTLGATSRAGRRRASAD